MAFVLVTPPASEPLSYSEAAAHLRLEEPQDQDYVLGLIAAARQWVEAYLGRALINQTWELVLDRFPGFTHRDVSLALGYLEHPHLGRRVEHRQIVLAKGQLQSVTSLKYIDATGVEQTLPTNLYQVDTDQQPGRVLPAVEGTWPDTQIERVGAVRVRFVAGYGAAATAVPAPIKAAMLFLIAQLYENREPEVTGAIVSQHQFAIDALLSPYRVHGWGS